MVISDEVKDKVRDEVLAETILYFDNAEHSVVRFAVNEVYKRLEKEKN